MYFTKLYKYDSSKEANGYRGEDFSRHLQIGSQNKEDITQELDTAEITLAGLSFEESFSPETKIIVDIVETNELGEENIIETQHFCISNDTVQKPILADDGYFDHHISFIEPSVVAQKRLVDNISATYQLKDVSLQEKPAIPDTKQSLYIESSIYTPENNFGYYQTGGWSSSTYRVWGKYFQLEGNLQILNNENVAYNDVYEDVERFRIGDAFYAKFRIPQLAIYGGISNSKNFAKIGYASIDYTIEEFSLTDSYNPIRSIKGSFISNSNLDANSNVYNPITGIDGASEYRKEWLPEQKETWDNWSGRHEDTGVRKYTETSAPTPTYVTDLIQIFPDRQYKVSISLHEFTDTFPFIREGGFWKWDGAITLYHSWDSLHDYGSPLGVNIVATASQTSGGSAFTTYEIDNLQTIVYSSATPYSALALLQKAIINSAIYEKQDGVYIADINNSNLPFYIDEAYIDKLNATVVIENFYNQKNLWEIMVEIGNYIHAIPELKFGKDDKFLITFNELGRTDEQEDKTNKISIFNSRGVEDYIAATSSYISNMVQLGGVVEEWVVPKTTDEELLVYNDTAELMVSKPIIELLKVVARRNSDGKTADITKYIYEENVYKTLGIDFKVEPNRGIAMYYTLGESVIKGGQYQLPQANTNIYTDYSFKKLLYSAFNGYPVVSPAPASGYWTELDTSEYSFFVRYRTKDSVRQSHIRPDLRKYLLNSKHDKYPTHSQFNNQTDVVVDSIKFGNNLYGKLIKTGNLSYTKTEWVDRYENLKHKGELYRINGDLYYVAKATHINFGTHFISEISFSKDYNELSQIIGIPSEPRFYEISEQSLIWREFEIKDFILLTDNKAQLDYNENYVFNYDHLADLVIGEGTDFAKYALTVYKGDKDANKYDQTVGSPSLYLEVLNPINAYSSENTLTYEWDMEDNYSAGNQVIDADTPAGTAKGRYHSLWAVKYTDVYGRAALMDFYILGDVGSLDVGEIRALPSSPISSKNEGGKFVGNYNILATNVAKYDTNFNGRGIGLLKDCREAMSINYNLQLITSSDTFVLSPYVFLPKKENVRIVLLAEEVNKLSSGYIDNATMIAPISKTGVQMSQYFTFDITKEKSTSGWDASKEIVSNFGIDLASVFSQVADEHFADTDNYQRVKAIAVVCDVSLNIGEDKQAPTIPYKTQFVFARNIPENWTREQALAPIYFGAPNKDNLFNNKQ